MPDESPVPIFLLPEPVSLNSVRENLHLARAGDQIEVPVKHLEVMNYLVHHLRGVLLVPKPVNTRFQEDDGLLGHRVEPVHGTDFTTSRVSIGCLEEPRHVLWSGFLDFGRCEPYILEETFRDPFGRFFYEFNDLGVGDRSRLRDLRVGWQSQKQQRAKRK